MIDFNQWLFISSVLAVLIWGQSCLNFSVSFSVNSSPSSFSNSSLGLWLLFLLARWRLLSLALPLASSLFLHDYLIRQSLSQWLQTLQPLAQVLAVGLSVMALLLGSIKSRHSLALYSPVVFLTLCYWQLLCLQSGVLPWAFDIQLYAVAVVFSLLINIISLPVFRALKYPLIILQCSFSWWWFCQWPQSNNHLTVSLSESLISMALFILCVLAGVVFEKLRAMKNSKEAVHESIY